MTTGAVTRCAWTYSSGLRCKVPCIEDSPCCRIHTREARAGVINPIRKMPLSIIRVLVVHESGEIEQQLVPSKQPQCGTHINGYIGSTTNPTIMEVARDLRVWIDEYVVETHETNEILTELVSAVVGHRILHLFGTGVITGPVSDYVVGLTDDQLQLLMGWN